MAQLRLDVLRVGSVGDQQAGVGMSLSSHSRLLKCAKQGISLVCQPVADDLGHRLELLGERLGRALLAYQFDDPLPELRRVDFPPEGNNVHGSGSTSAQPIRRPLLAFR